MRTHFCILITILCAQPQAVRCDEIFDAKVIESKQAAAEEFPDLKNPESRLFKLVVEAIPVLKQNNPEMFTRPNWPRKVTRLCARMLEQQEADEKAEASANAAQERRQVIGRIREIEAMRDLLVQNGTRVDALDEMLRILRLRLARLPPGEDEAINLNAGNVVVESRIDGDFEGWEDETVFRLENGQTWQQNDFRFRYTYKFRPKVAICRSGGRYFMVVENFKDAVEVEPLR